MLIPLETPAEWMARWRVWIVVIGVALLAWLMWWSDVTRGQRNREEQEGDVLESLDVEHKMRVEEQRAHLEQRAEAAMTKPLTLEEEMVSLHNLQLVARVHSDSA